MLALLGELLSNLFGQIGTIISSVLVIWAFVDCVTDKRRSNKVPWILFILFTQFIGAAVYFISGQSHTLPRVYQFLKKWLWETDTITYYQPAQPSASPAPDQQPYRAYQEGYQVQDYQPATYTPASPQEELATEPQSSLYADYEQPQAMYPQMPQ